MSQLDFPMFVMPSASPVVVRPAYDVNGAPVLPLRVRCAPFWWNFAWLILNGHKSVETRGRPWSGDKPGWLAIYATLGCGSRNDRPLLPEGVEVPKDAPRGVITGLIWIDGSRCLDEADTVAACYPYAPNRYAWEIGAVVPFATPLALADVNLKRAPQSIVKLDSTFLSRAFKA